MEVRLKEPLLVPEGHVFLRNSPIPFVLTTINGRCAVQCWTKAETKHTSWKEVSGLGGIASPAMDGWQQLTVFELETFGEPRAWEGRPLIVCPLFPFIPWFEWDFSLLSVMVEVHGWSAQVKFSNPKKSSLSLHRLRFLGSLWRGWFEQNHTGAAGSQFWLHKCYIPFAVCGGVYRIPQTALFICIVCNRSKMWFFPSLVLRSGWTILLKLSQKPLSLGQTACMEKNPTQTAEIWQRWTQTETHSCHGKVTSDRQRSPLHLAETHRWSMQLTICAPQLGCVCSKQQILCIKIYTLLYTHAA